MKPCIVPLHYASSFLPAAKETHVVIAFERSRSPGQHQPKMTAPEPPLPSTEIPDGAEGDVREVAVITPPGSTTRSL